MMTWHTRAREREHVFLRKTPPATVAQVAMCVRMTCRAPLDFGRRMSVDWTMWRKAGPCVPSTSRSADTRVPEAFASLPWRDETIDLFSSQTRETRSLWQSVGRRDLRVNLECQPRSSSDCLIVLRAQEDNNIQRDRTERSTCRWSGGDWDGRVGG